MSGDDPHDGAHAPPPGALVAIVASRANITFLNGYLRSAHPSLSSHDADDVRADIMARLIGRINSGQWVPLADPAMLRGYLRRAADWAVVDFHRRSRRSRESLVSNEVLQDLALTDDQAVAVVTAAVTTDGVRAALRRIHDSGDSTLFVVVTHILDHIQRTGERPSNRQTAAACGLSHTAVANALIRMRPYFEPARKDSQNG